MCFNAICENKILAKISEFTVSRRGPLNVPLVLIAYAQKTPLNTHTDLFSVVRGQNCGLDLHLHQYFYTETAKALASMCMCAGSP